MSDTQYLRPLVKATRVSGVALEALRDLVDGADRRDEDEVLLDRTDVSGELLHHLSTARMIEFVFGLGVLEAPNGLKFTVLGRTTALTVRLMDEARERAEVQPVTVKKVPREYRADGSSGKFVLREYRRGIELPETVEKFPTRKQAEHVAALLNEALAW